VVKWDGKDDVGEWECRPPEGFGEECPEWEREVLCEVIFVGVDDIRDEFVTKGTRGEDAIEWSFSSAGMTERAIRRYSFLAVRAVQVDFSRKISRTTITEERASRFAGKAGEWEKEVKERLKKYFHFPIMILSSDNYSIVQSNQPRVRSIPPRTFPLTFPLESVRTSPFACESEL
jgi:hypothetical protein